MIPERCAVHARTCTIMFAIASSRADRFFRHREGNISAYVIEVQLLCPETTDSSRPTVPIQEVDTIHSTSFDTELLVFRRGRKTNYPWRREWLNIQSRAATV
ncbi:uncharacterized protein LOC118467228 [Anopheles albimanus]|uniref:uncharacterized protein LOC118467228 n=1 Tax=Anopheles albimanus TaxID=7167 RepID=UPI00163E17BA|nr:uncharacterized protein LOC118467228 [Anopheles albimanus]